MTRRAHTRVTEPWIRARVVGVKALFEDEDEYDNYGSARRLLTPLISARCSATPATTSKSPAS